MAIRFWCPGCHKPLSVAPSKAGTQATCPACQAELIVPRESSRPKPLSPAVPAPAATLSCEPSFRPRRWSRAVLAGILLVIGCGLGAGTLLAFLGKDQDPSSAQAQPAETGQPPDVAQSDTPPDEVEAPAMPASNPEESSTVAEAKTEAANPLVLSPFDPAGPAVREPAEAPAPQPPERPEVLPPAPPAAKPQPQQHRKKPAEIVRERWASKRRSRATDDELRQQLLLPPEVDLEAVPGASKKVISLSGKSAGTGVDVVPQVSARRADLLGLPLRTGVLARMGQEEALNLKVLSQQLRFEVQASIPGVVQNVVDPRPDPDNLRQRLLASPLQAAWLRPQAIATLRQLLMHEHRNVRLILVEVLSKIDGRLASLALAERAVFDLHPDVRLAALVALQSRPTTEFESALIAGLRYPWPAAAEHAAEALVALELRDAVPKLIPLLDVRDLSEPYPVDLGQMRLAVVPELVRMNHLRNCLLCHAYSPSVTDPVRGLAPHAEHLVPLPASGTRTTSNSKWGGGGGGSSASLITPTFVRADITFLRQDFSVVQPVANHGRLWPADQRYDYLLRLRPLKPEQLLVWQDSLKDFRTAEPQRESLLFALRELTGEDLGPSAEDWKRYYSPITGRRLLKPLDPADQVPHLKDSLVEGSPLQQAERLMLFRQKSGAAYDTALALAIPQMNVELQKLGRTILADRLFCLPLKQLGEKLGDPDAEVRRAAVTVCRQRKLKVLVPELIALLDDGSQDVAHQAHQVLQHFASRDLGPRRGADREERLQAMAAWRDWWEQQKQKQTAPKGRAS